MHPNGKRRIAEFRNSIIIKVFGDLEENFHFRLEHRRNYVLLNIRRGYLKHFYFCLSIFIIFHFPYDVRIVETKLRNLIYLTWSTFCR
jgi:hypothetical protein